MLVKRVGLLVYDARRPGQAGDRGCDNFLGKKYTRLGHARHAVLLLLMLSLGETLLFYLELTWKIVLCGDVFIHAAV